VVPLTESLFRAERLAYLQKLQKTLSRLKKWMKNRSGNPVDNPNVRVGLAEAIVSDTLPCRCHKCKRTVSQRETILFSSLFYRLNKCRHGIG